MVKFTEKLWIRTVAFLLLLVLLLPPLASCADGDKNDDDDGTTVESVDTIIEEKKVMLIENGKILYRVVRADKADPVAKKQAAKVANALSAVAGSTAEIVTDWEDSAENSEIKEILVGATNREESRRAVEELEINDYLIRVTGNKIVICGGSEKAMDAAVDYFLLQYLGYLSESSFTVTKDLGIPETTDLKLTYEDEREIVLAVFNSTVTYADALKQALSSLGENIRLLNRTADILEALDADKTSLFILAGADTVPVGFNEKLDTYLKNSGRLITLGGPAFETVLYEQNGGSVLDRETYLASYMDKVDGAKVQTVLDTSSRSDVDLMTHSSDNGANVKTTIGSYGSTHSKYQLQVEVPSLSNYDLLTKSVKVSPGSAYGVGFYAKGSADTDRLYIEIKDKNGCRWFATVELTMEWKYYLLYASDFTYYATWEVKKVGTEVVFSNAATVSIGFAQNSAEIATGHHLYYLDRIQFIGYLDAIKQEKGLLIDGMAPETQVFPVTNASQMVTYSGQTILTDRNYAVPASSISCSSGRQGTGYNKDRSNRFIPLLEILDEKGLHAGYGAWINLLSGTGKRNGDYEGAVVGAVGATDNAFYNTEGIAAVVEMASAMLKDWFLLEGGTDEYIYPVQDSPTAVVGANYICLNENTEEKATVSVALYSGERLLKKWEQNSEGTSPASGGYYNLKGTYAIPGENPDRVVTTLSVNGSVRDRIEHSITLWSPKKESERQYVTTSDGHYMRGGKILNLYGINYMPTTSTAETDETDYDQYVKKSSYDPDVVWKDLLRIKEIGFNSVSIYVYYRNMVDCNNILDMIDKCDKLGLYVDLSIRSFAYPMDYRENEVETLINRLHFAEIDRIVAYDIAWEKAVGRYLENSLRKSWDADWREWINVQYGSLDNAEAAWGCKAPTDSTGAVIGATDAMLLESSSSALVAAYRRFVDDKVSEVFAEKTNHIRSLDPNHLVSFRMAYSGTPNHPANYFAYDYQSLASTLDFMSPEGYGIASNEDSAIQVLFNNTYARYTNPDKPIMWKEFGFSVWSGSNFRTNGIKLQKQYAYYQYLLDYIYRSNTGALYCWFFGNYRINEDSDYGILNPDGSDRPATALLREYASKFLNQSDDFTAEVLITVERDDYANGITGLFQATKQQLLDAMRTGKTVAYVNKQQSAVGEVFYADEVLDEAVGGKKGTGIYPLRYVNGLVKNVTVKQEGDKKVAYITVTNTLYATWRAGSVKLVSTENSKIDVDVTVTEELGYLEETTLRVELSGSGKLALRFSVDGVMFGAERSLIV